MAFVAGRLIAITAGGTAPLPAGVDLSGNSPSFTMYSHMRVPAGPVTITFDTGQSFALSGDTTFPIPPGALQVLASGAITAQLGRMVG